MHADVQDKTNQREWENKLKSTCTLILESNTWACIMYSACINQEERRVEKRWRRKRGDMQGRRVCVCVCVCVSLGSVCVCVCVCLLSLCVCVCVCFSWFCVCLCVCVYVSLGSVCVCVCMFLLALCVCVCVCVCDSGDRE